MKIEQQDKVNVPYLYRVEEIVRQALAGTPCQVYLFGSRATGASQPGSDVDIAVDAGVNISRVLSQIRLALEESTIPYKVDVVDLSRTSADFRRQVLADGILLWQN